MNLERARSVRRGASLVRRARQQLDERVAVGLHVIDDEYLAVLRDAALRGERERERGPDPDRALRPEIATHESRMSEADREAQAGATRDRTGLELLEWQEDPSEVCGGNS